MNSGQCGGHLSHTPVCCTCGKLTDQEGFGKCGEECVCVCVCVCMCEIYEYLSHVDSPQQLYFFRCMSVCVVCIMLALLNLTYRDE